MRASRNARSAIGTAVCLAAAWSLGPSAGWTEEQEREPPSAVIARPVCAPARNPPDLSIPTPQVVSTYPAQGQVVSPGYLVIRVTFNVAMTCAGTFLSRPPLMKPCEGQRKQDVMLSYDRRTVQMVCRVAKSARYGFRLNYDPEFFAGERQSPEVAKVEKFVSLAGSAAKRFELTFSTSSGPGVTSLKDALATELVSEPPEAFAPRPQ